MKNRMQDLDFEQTVAFDLSFSWSDIVDQNKIIIR